jgi:hypothetical protein
VILSAQGMARVLVGNINSEYASILTGHVPLGPGWFKEGNEESPNRVKDFGVIIWSLGVLATLVFSLSIYWLFTSRVVRTWALLNQEPRLFFVWLLVSAALLVAVPQVYGDARFRAPVWALLVAGFSLLPIVAGSEKRT